MSDISTVSIPAIPDSYASLPTKRPVGRPRKAEGVVNSATADNKQSIYFGTELLSTLRQESTRLGRSLSWTVAKLCTMGLAALREMPSVDDDN